MKLLFIKRKYAKEILAKRKLVEYRLEPLKPGWYILFAGKKMGYAKLGKPDRIKISQLSVEERQSLKQCYGWLPEYVYSHWIRDVSQLPKTEAKP